MYLLKLRDSATAKFPRDAETRDEFIAKELMKSSIYSGDKLVFDNVVLVAADANNEDHPSWVNRIQFRNRLYITINENDSALKLSRAKMGSQQKALNGETAMAG